MEFDFEEEGKRVAFANENVNGVIDRYNGILASLSEREKNIIMLHYAFKKLDTIRNMTPEGNYFDDKRDGYIKRALDIIESIRERFYPDAKDLDELCDRVSHDMDGKLSNILTDFSTDLKKSYMAQCDHVFTVLPLSGLTELIQSKHRENQYLSRIYDGIFSTTTMSSIEKYIGRANVHGMIVRGREINYPSNPFSSITEEALTLVKPVSIYLSTAEFFKPQFDYEIDPEGRPHFIYGGEWIAERPTVPCIETQTSYLPPSFIERNAVYYQAEGDRVLLESCAMKK